MSSDVPPMSDDAQLCDGASSSCTTELCCKENTQTPVIIIVVILFAVVLMVVGFGTFYASWKFSRDANRTRAAELSSNCPSKSAASRRDPNSKKMVSLADSLLEQSRSFQLSATLPSGVQQKLSCCSIMNGAITTRASMIILPGGEEKDIGPWWQVDDDLQEVKSADLPGIPGGEPGNWQNDCKITMKGPKLCRRKSFLDGSWSSECRSPRTLALTALDSPVSARTWFPSLRGSQRDGSSSNPSGSHKTPLQLEKQITRVTFKLESESNGDQSSDNQVGAPNSSSQNPGRTTMISFVSEPSFHSDDNKSHYSQSAALDSPLQNQGRMTVISFVSNASSILDVIESENADAIRLPHPVGHSLRPDMPLPNRSPSAEDQQRHKQFAQSGTISKTKHDATEHDGVQRRKLIPRLCYGNSDGRQRDTMSLE
eukprot:GEMP01019051.1.p1 GENE.GEMP01019051.1~~GEMP01019051.1.p1  ORF type:complete len:427 (+),score=57.70 GEMP01019051.1:232-1512(+)